MRVIIGEDFSLVHAGRTMGTAETRYAEHKCVQQQQEYHRSIHNVAFRGTNCVSYRYDVLL